LTGGGLARRPDSRERVLLNAVAQALSAGRSCGAGGRRRPLGLDLGPFGPIWVRAGRLVSARRRGSLEVEKVLRR
jgi:hypothetical protein